MPLHCCHCKRKIKYSVLNRHFLILLELVHCIFNDQKLLPVQVLRQHKMSLPASATATSKTGLSTAVTAVEGGRGELKNRRAL